MALSFKGPPDDDALDTVTDARNTTTAPPASWFLYFYPRQIPPPADCYFISHANVRSSGNPARGWSFRMRSLNSALSCVFWGGPGDFHSTLIVPAANEWYFAGCVVTTNNIRYHLYRCSDGSVQRENIASVPWTPQGGGDRIRIAGTPKLQDGDFADMIADHPLIIKQSLTDEQVDFTFNRGRWTENTCLWAHLGRSDPEIDLSLADDNPAQQFNNLSHEGTPANAAGPPIGSLYQSSAGKELIQAAGPLRPPNCIKQFGDEFKGLNPSFQLNYFKEVGNINSVSGV